MNCSNLTASNSDNDVEKKVKAPLVNFRLLKNPVFLLINVSYIIANMGFLVPYVYFIDVAISKVDHFCLLIASITKKPINYMLTGYWT